MGVPCGCGCDARVFSGFGVAGGEVGCGCSTGADVGCGCSTAPDVGCGFADGWVAPAGGCGWVPGACWPLPGGADVGSDDSEPPE